MLYRVKIRQFGQEGFAEKCVFLFAKLIFFFQAANGDMQKCDSFFAKRMFFFQATNGFMEKWEKFNCVSHVAKLALEKLIVVSQFGNLCLEFGSLCLALCLETGKTSLEVDEIVGCDHVTRTDGSSDSLPHSMTTIHDVHVSFENEHQQHDNH